MKKVIIATAAIAAFATFSNAQETTATPTTNVETKEVKDEQQKTPVKLEELPAEVKTTLSGNDFKGWTATSAYWIKADKGYYEIELVNGQQKTVVKLDEKGQKVA